jgi:hypothetical protein
VFTHSGKLLSFLPGWAGVFPSEILSYCLETFAINLCVHLGTSWWGSRRGLTLAAQTPGILELHLCCYQEENLICELLKTYNLKKKKKAQNALPAFSFIV